jgi:hypothetical protein
MSTRNVVVIACDFIQILKNKLDRKTTTSNKKIMKTRHFSEH